MKTCIKVLLLLFISNYSIAQIADSVANAIKCVLLEKGISAKVFYKYDAEDRVGPFLLPGGQNQAFIYPDTTFQKVFKGIKEILTYKSVDGYYDVHLLYKDSDHAIYVNRGMQTELCIVFEKIYINSNRAAIDFFTSSMFPAERFKDHYVRVRSNLINDNDHWKVEKYEVFPIEWIEVEKQVFIKYRK